MAKPYTDEQKQRLLDAVSRGATDQDACAVIGCRPKTLIKWKEDVNFSTLYARARARRREGQVNKILDHDDWRAAAWYIEHEGLIRQTGDDLIIGHMQLPALGPKVHSLHDGGLAWGATNSGKSYGMAHHFVREAILAGRRGEPSLLIGSSLGLLQAEIMPMLRNIAEGWGYTTDDYRRSTQTLTLDSARVLVRAGAKAGDEERLRSIHHVAAVMAEEVSAIPETFFDMAISRQEWPGQRVYATCNPAGPTNWVKQRLDEGRWPNQAMCLLDDNPSLTPEQRQQIADQFVGTFRSRMIEAQWVAPAGLVYSAWTESQQAAIPGRNCWVGADYGESNVTCAVYVQLDDDGRYIVTREYYYDASRQGKRNSPQHVEAIVANAPGPIVGAWVDPSARDLKAAFRKAGIQTHNGYNKLDGYGVVDGLLQRGLLLINSTAVPELAQQLYSLIWNRTGDHPDPNCIDHATDALRYVAYSLRRTSLYGAHT
ncbi:MAG: phage terminase large subunit [Rhodospirillaceae bacterium]|nr:phage terminase large subunit [Rhodospirillaceae bacterium]